MKPYYQDEWVQIYLGDCRDILPELPKVDLVLTDPPFNVGKDYGKASDSISTHEYSSLLEVVSYHTYEISNPDTNCLVKASTKFLPLFLSAFNHWCYKWMLGMYVPNSMKPMSRGFNQLGLVIWSTKGDGKKYTFANDVYIHNRDGNMRSDGEKHPNPMDSNFVSRLITDYSEKGSLVIDPFLGSGTTAYCAKKLNRKCIGIEIEEKYCEIAAKRCSQGVFDFSDARYGTKR